MSLERIEIQIGYMDKEIHETKEMIKASIKRQEAFEDEMRIQWKTASKEYMTKEEFKEKFKQMVQLFWTVLTATILNFVNSFLNK